jgi:hypothetical protein
MSLAAVAPLASSAGPSDDFRVATIRFEIAERDLIPGIAAVRAVCDVRASGEALTLRSNESEHSTLAVTSGPCSIVLALAGIDLAIPVLNATPLGTRSFYLPGVATATIGIVDVSLDLVASLHSTSWIEDGIGGVLPQEILWQAWGAHRIHAQGHDGFGGVARSHLRTDFTYRMSLALSVYALSLRLYHVDLAEIASVVGTTSLATPFAVDLRPGPLVLAPAEDIRHDRATLSWRGSVESDVDRLELWLSDGRSEGMVRLPASASTSEVLLRPTTAYRAWIVSVDSSGQGTPSNEIAFESTAAPADAPPLASLGGQALTGTLVALAIGLALVGYALGVRRGKKAR